MQIGNANLASVYYPMSGSLPARPVSTDSSPDLARATQAPVTPAQSLEAPGDQPAESPEERLQRPGDQEARSPRELAEEGTARQRQQAEEERQRIERLASRDREVRNHEQAHAAVGSRYAGPPAFTYTRGPDGKSYATSGEVSIDVSPVPNDPEATLRKMEIVQRAALAPAEPSAQDLRVAAQAQALAAQARSELNQLRREQDAAARAERKAEAERAEEEEQAKAVEEDERERPEQSLPPGPSLELYRRLETLREPSEALSIQA